MIVSSQWPEAVATENRSNSLVAGCPCRHRKARGFLPGGDRRGVVLRPLSPQPGARPAGVGPIRPFGRSRRPSLCHRLPQCRRLRAEPTEEFTLAAYAHHHDLGHRRLSAAVSRVPLLDVGHVFPRPGHRRTRLPHPRARPAPRRDQPMDASRQAAGRRSTGCAARSTRSRRRGNACSSTSTTSTAGRCGSMPRSC
jgi:hypothetical protein